MSAYLYLPTYLSILDNCRFAHGGKKEQSDPMHGIQSPPIPRGRG